MKVVADLFEEARVKLFTPDCELSRDETDLVEVFQFIGSRCLTVVPLPMRRALVEQNDYSVKAKGRRSVGPFVPIPTGVLCHSNFVNLTHKAKALLLDLAQQVRFKEGGTVNNGDLSVAFTVMQDRGWTSKDTLRRLQRTRVLRVHYPNAPRP